MFWTNIGATMIELTGYTRDKPLYAAIRYVAKSDPAYSRFIQPGRTLQLFQYPVAEYSGSAARSLFITEIPRSRDLVAQG